MIHNRVWIELEKPRDDKHAQEICILANRMFQRLRGNGVPDSTFEWDAERQRFSYGNMMGRKVLSDNGNWYSLDYMGREA